MLFGGGRLGLMGITADAALAAGATVTGIIPEVFVDKEQAHTGVSHLEVVKDMIVRKKKLIQLGDAFVNTSRGIWHTGRIRGYCRLGSHLSAKQPPGYRSQHLRPL